MFCEKCGKEMLDTAKFCPSCGAKNEPAPEDPVAEDTTVEAAEPEIEHVVEPEPAVTEPVPPPQPSFVNSKDLTKPLSTASYFGMFFLMAIPLIRLIMLLVWSFSDNVNVNKKHFAHALFIWILVSLILAIVAVVVLFILFGANFYEEFKIW